MQVSRPAPNVLDLTRGRLRSVVGIVLWAAFCAYWYSSVLNVEERPAGTSLLEYLTENPSLLAVFVVPLLGVPWVLNAIRVSVLGETLRFDGAMRTVTRNRRVLATFDDVKHLQLRSTGGHDKVHWLTMILRDGKKLEIEHGSDLAEVVALADGIADVVRVEVVRK